MPFTLLVGVLLAAPTDPSILTVHRIVDPPTHAENLAVDAAIRHGISVNEFLTTLRCESGDFQHNGQSFVKDPNGPNGRENSWGYAQIHLDSHPQITKDQAVDPRFALDWAASEFAKGNEWMWTCWRHNFG